MMKSETCSACRKAIIFASMGGRIVAVEKVTGRRGDIALTEDLLERRAPLASRVANRTGHRLHEPHCPGLRSFTMHLRREVVR
jgi:hypothetical protein